MRMAVMDTETTGIDELDQVIEVAGISVRQPGYVGIKSSREDGRWSTLIKPTVPVTIGARATHHITDGELAHGESLWSAIVDLAEQLEPDDHDDVVFVAHNAEFDLRMIRQTCEAADVDPADVLPDQHICTWICAKHLYPDSPGHSNQVLRYYLGLDTLYPEMSLQLLAPGMAVHRAPADALVTSRLLMEMLRMRTVEELIVLTQTPVLQVYCKMPKHPGKTWAEVAAVDPEYMRWILRQGPEVKLPGGNKTGFDADTIHTLKFHLGLLEN